MDNPNDRLGELLHDLNGEIFVMRGHIDLALKNVDDRWKLEQGMENLRARTDEVERIIREMRGQLKTRPLRDADEL